MKSYEDSDDIERADIRSERFIDQLNAIEARDDGELVALRHRDTANPGRIAARRNRGHGRIPV